MVPDFISESHHYYDNIGVPYKKGWTLKKVHSFTYLHNDYNIKTIYNYNDIYLIVKDKTREYNLFNNEIKFQKLDEYIWEEWTKLLEKSRVFFVDSLIEYGINEIEAYFLSINFCISTISKFRLQMFIEFGGQQQKATYNKTAFRNAINTLYHRFKNIAVYDKYIWSVEAVDERITSFREAFAIETAKLLAEETGAIIHTKLTL